MAAWNAELSSNSQEITSEEGDAGRIRFGRRLLTDEETPCRFGARVIGVELQQVASGAKACASLPRCSNLGSSIWQTGMKLHKNLLDHVLLPSALRKTAGECESFPRIHGKLPLIKVRSFWSLEPIEHWPAQAALFKGITPGQMWCTQWRSIED